MSRPMSIFDISGRAMAAQMVRLNTTASNMANAGSIAGSEASAYRSMKPVFRAINEAPGLSTVQVDGIVTSTATPTRRHDPSHPMADANGDIWEAAVDPTAEMVEMMDSARQYQNNVQVLDTARTLILDTIRIGR